MKGRILDFDAAGGTGIITGADQRRYSFAVADWRDAAAPVRGQKVDFDPQDDRAAAVFRDGGMLGVDAAGNATGNAMTMAIVSIVLAVVAFFIPILGLFLSIGAFIVGRRARRAAATQGDQTAGTVALIAVIVSAISLAITAVFALMAFAAMLGLGGLAMFG